MGFLPGRLTCWTRKKSLARDVRSQIFDLNTFPEKDASAAEGKVFQTNLEAAFVNTDSASSEIQHRFSHGFDGPSVEMADRPQTHLNMDGFSPEEYMPADGIEVEGWGRPDIGLRIPGRQTMCAWPATQTTMPGVRSQQGIRLRMASASLDA